jgi:hypothetical protein
MIIQNTNGKIFHFLTIHAYNMTRKSARALQQEKKLSNLYGDEDMNSTYLFTWNLGCKLWPEEQATLPVKHRPLDHDQMARATP